MTTTPFDPDALLERLGAVRGFDLASALRNVGGNPAALARVLRTFTGRYRDGEPALVAPVSADSVAQWRACCHSLRGACATIGAASLPGGFTAFESALAAASAGGADLQALGAQARALNDELVRAVTALSAAIAPPGTTS